MKIKQNKEDKLKRVGTRYPNSELNFQIPNKKRTWPKTGAPGAFLAKNGCT